LLIFYRHAAYWEFFSTIKPCKSPPDHFSGHLLTGTFFGDVGGVTLQQPILILMKLFTSPLTRVMAMAFVIAITSCTKDSVTNDVIFDIRGTSSPVNPQNSNAAYGNIIGGYSATNNKIAFNINWYNLSSRATGSSLRFDNGQAEEVIKTFTVTEGTTTGLTAGEMQLTDEQVKQLLNGEWFYTVNTVNHPEGELVGKMQVLRTQ
jgi:hypothetical protein